MIFVVVFFLPSNPKTIFHQEGICKSFLEIMEGYMTTREKHLTNVHHDKPGFSSAAPVFDPKQFKANKEVLLRILDRDVLHRFLSPDPIKD